MHTVTDWSAKAGRSSRRLSPTGRGAEATGRDAGPVAGRSRLQALVAGRSRLQALAAITVFDIAGPLVVYSLLRSAGWRQVAALVVSGMFPLLGVVLGLVLRRRLDVVGAVVLLGIAVGTVVGLASGNARLYLLEGSVPTAVFGAVCLASLWSRRPLMFRFALQFLGPGTSRGHDFADRWRYAGFRHTFRVITAVWAVVYLLEAAARVAIVETTSTGAALAISKVGPYVVAAALVVWMTVYGMRAKRRGERLAAQTADRERPRLRTS